MGDYRTDTQVTHDALFGTGILGEPQYFWWLGFEAGHAQARDGLVPPYWYQRIRALRVEDPDGDEAPLEREVWHSTVVEAIDGILAGDFSDASSLPPRRNPVSPATVEDCRKLASDPEHGYLAWDHLSSDGLLQVIVYGGVVW